jgi:hypothetical protein
MVNCKCYYTSLIVIGTNNNNNNHAFQPNLGDMTVASMAPKAIIKSKQFSIRSTNPMANNSVAKVEV